jgi:hypothetical protein
MITRMDFGMTILNKKWKYIRNNLESLVEFTLNTERFNKFKLLKFHLNIK